MSINKSAIKNLANAINDAPSAANLLMLASSILLLYKVYILNEIIKPGNLQTLGLIIEGTLISVIASYIFYIIVVQIKETQDKAITAPYIKKHCKRIISIRNELLRELSKASSSNLNAETLTKEKLEEALTSIKALSDAPMLDGSYPPKKVNWLSYLDFYAHSIKKSIAKLLEKPNWLNADIVYILTEVEEDSYISFRDAMKGIQFEYGTLRFLSSGILSFNQHCNKLQNKLKELKY